MSINIGTAGVEAAAALRNSSDWKAIRDALFEQVGQQMNAALTAGEQQTDRCAYARALRDLWIAFESATNGVPYAQVKKPGLQEKSRA